MSLIEVLKKNTSCEILFNDTDRLSRETDESIFKILPLGIVFPQNEEDVKIVVEIAAQHNVAITARGGGTGIAGQSIGAGIILDFSRHMNKILDISSNQAIVQPGLVLADLNQNAFKQHQKFAPDPGSWDRCTIGGMIATNAAGPHALAYGSTRDHVRSMELVLANGAKTNTQQLGKGMEMYIQHISKHKKLIQQTQKNVEKNSSGYYLEAFLENPVAFQKLIVGSEGTLAIVTQATIKLTTLPPQVEFAVFGFESMGRALMQVKELRASKACCIELLDQTILQVLQKQNPSMIAQLKLENAKASLWVEWNQSIPATWKKNALFITKDKNEMSKIWSQRSKVSKWLHEQALHQSRQPLRCIEDACVPIDSLVTYVTELNDLLERHDCSGAIFGHVGSGHLHVNPAIRTDLPNLEQRIKNLMDEFYDLVIALGGTISGEHGDGILRVAYAKKQWKEIWPLFEFVKKSFDPMGILNPDKKVPLVPRQWPELKY